MEPTYVEQLGVESKKVGDALRFSALVLSRLRRLPYAAHFRDCVRYYGRALGEADWATSYILLWQALEAATGTSKMKYDATIRRASFMFDDVEYHKQVLDILKTCRNEIVHAQNDPTSLESRLYLLKRYVESALRFHLAHAGDFHSLEEAGHFLDLPSNTAVLNRRLRLLEKAATFRES